MLGVGRLVEVPIASLYTDQMPQKSLSQLIDVDHLLG